MTIANSLGSQFHQFAVHFIHRDRASLDIDQPMRVAAKISDDAVLSMNGDAIAISVFKRRGDHWPHRNIFEFSDSLKNVAHLARFYLELMRVIDVLVGATAAMTEVRTRRLDSMRRALAKIDNLRFGELFFLSGDFYRGQFPIDRERNENGLAVVPRDSLSAERDVLDF